MMEKNAYICLHNKTTTRSDKYTRMARTEAKDYITIAREFTDKYLKLSEEDLQLFASLIDERRKLKKGEVFITEGMVCRHLVYIDKGLVRQFYYKDGHDVTEHFASDGISMHCIESVYHQVPTRLMAEALEPSVVYYVNYARLADLMEKSVGLCRFYRIYQEEDLIISQHKADAIRFDSSKDRYERFLREYPEAAKRAPLQHIASYLLMTPETLSRVRAGTL